MISFLTSDQKEFSIAKRQKEIGRYREKERKKEREKESEREKERESEREKEREREREREKERERERKREQTLARNKETGPAEYNYYEEQRKEIRNNMQIIELERSKKPRDE